MNRSNKCSLFFRWSLLLYWLKIQANGRFLRRMKNKWEIKQANKKHRTHKHNNNKSNHNEQTGVIHAMYNILMTVHHNIKETRSKTVQGNECDPNQDVMRLMTRWWLSSRVYANEIGRMKIASYFTMESLCLAFIHLSFRMPWNIMHKLMWKKPKQFWLGP